jgi:16S rRNA processing protein RimM
VAWRSSGVQTISEAEPYSNQLVCVPMEERIELEPGEVFYGELIGCEVFQDGVKLGTVDDYQETAGPVLLEMGPHLIPFVPAICVHVDTAAKRMEVKLPEGFLELNA